jgi:signal transduction histidine kinase
MIISQILLTLFLGYWVYAQFLNQKRLLTEEIKREFMKVEQQVIDTMLANNLINPILNDSSNFQVVLLDSTTNISHNYRSSYKLGGDTSIKKIVHLATDSIEIIATPESSDPVKELGVSIIDKAHSPNVSSITIHSEQDADSQLLLQSVRLLIYSVGQHAPNQGIMSSFVYSNVDTLLLKKLFNSFIETSYEGISVQWLGPDGDETANNSQSGIQIHCSMCDTCDIYIVDYHTYLFKSISPQLVFAILLLIITAVAFRMAYTNLKDQRKLIVIKNDFISNITHELKTPVSTVKVALEALLDFDRKKDPQRTKEYLEMAHSEMNRLDLLVNQVLNNSALEDGNSFIIPESIDLKIIVNEVLQSLQPRFEKQDVEINFECTNNSVIVDADSLHLHGVLVNLIDNSLKYSTAKAKISVNLTQNENEAILTIDDNGIGIPSEYIDKVFDKFFRVPNKDKHNVKGYGLGLNYAALVMQQHQGTISVKNLDEGGCRFTLILPNKV